MITFNPIQIFNILCCEKPMPIFADEWNETKTRNYIQGQINLVVLGPCATFQEEL